MYTKLLNHVDNHCCQYYKESVIRALSRKLGQCPILVKKGTFLEKKCTKNFTNPYSIPFVNVLYQNKDLNNFHKRG